MTDIKLNGSGSSAVQFQYDALSRRTKLVYENGCATNYTFEVDNDLSSLLHNFVGSNVQFNYSFDNANQMATHRVSDPANFRWTPPAPATTSYGTASNINQYPTVGGTAQTYSTDGNLTNDGTFKYEFNIERMMTRVRNAGTNAIIADYLYDPAQRQRQKNVGGVKTNYYYSGFQRLADYDGSAGTPGTLLNRYVYGLGLDEVLIQISAGGTKTYYHQNHQGSVIATTNSSGAVLNRYTYGPFGESTALTGTTHGYTGQRYDPETGLYYYKMRQYSAKLGRFLQPDPIGMAGGINLYAYVGNSPLSMIDSLGLFVGPPGITELDAQTLYWALDGLLKNNPDEVGQSWKKIPEGILPGPMSTPISNGYQNGINAVTTGFTDIIMTHPLASGKHGWIDTPDDFWHSRNDFRGPYEQSQKTGDAFRIWTMNKDHELFAYDGLANAIWGWRMDAKNVHLEWFYLVTSAYVPWVAPKIFFTSNVQVSKQNGTTNWNTVDQDGNVVGSFQTFTGGLFVSGFDYSWGIGSANGSNGGTGGNGSDGGGTSK